MKKNHLFVFLLLTFILLFDLRGYSQTIQLSGFDVSMQSNYGTSPLPPTTTAANVTAGGLTRGSGVITTGQAAAGGFGGTGFNYSDANSAISANIFFTFSLNANPGYKISFSNINPFNYRRSATGPPSGLLQYQINSGAFIDITSLTFTSTSSTGGSIGPIDLSGISALQNVPSSSIINFRIVPYGATSSQGAFYIFDKATGSDLAVNGNVISSPNHAPTLDPINNINISQNSSSQTVNLTGITDGGDGGQILSVTASSNNTSVIPNPSVTYTSPNTTGSLSFTPVSGTSGAATITVTVTDNGGTANGGVNTFSRQFTINVAAGGPLPTIYYPRTSATDLSQAGNWTDDPAGTAGTSPAGFTSANQLFNITRNAVVSGAWMISGGTNVVLSVSGLIFSPTSSLTIGSGSNFDFGGNNNYSTTFKSIQTNTAYLGQLTGTISNANNVTVERYISSQNNRAYRLLAPSVNTATSIHYNWQENASGRTDNPTPTYGTHITGTTVDQTNGFDVTSTGQGSLFTYNQTGGGSWVPATNTNATTLDAKTGYLLYIRGDRSIDLTSQSSPLPSTNTTLRTFGSLLQGTQTYTGLASNDFSLVTNPYASAINWNSIYNHAGTNNSTSFANYYTYWDPNIGSRGGYVTVTDGGTVSPTPSGGLPAGTVNIQSGQAFFVLSTTVSPTLTIQESDKSTTNNIDVFRTATPAAQKFTTSLYYNDAEHGRRLADGVTSLYDDSYNKAIDGNDAEEIPNWDENIAIARGGKQLSIEERPTITASDTLLLSMSNMKQQGYEFEFTPTGLNPNTIAVLIDNYSGAKTILDVTKTTVVPFTVTSAAASSATDRFYVIFKISGALPVTLTGVKAYQKNAGVQVEWTTQQEINTDRYELERATGVQPFTKIGTVSAKGNSSVSNYSLYDASPFSGVNFYRIKIIDKAGQVTYSDVVKVNISSQSNQITVTPNPVHSNTITLQMINMQKGSYTISLTNKLGQVVASKVIDHADGSSTETLTPSKAMSSGVYQLRVTGNGTSITRQVLKD